MVGGHHGVPTVHAVTPAEVGLNTNIDLAPIQHPETMVTTAKDLTPNQKNVAQIPAVRVEYQQL